MNIEGHKNELKNVCDELEKWLNEGSYPKKEDDVIALIQNLNNALYGDAVRTFVKTMESNRNIFSETEYNQIKPLLNKWKKNKWKFWKTQYIGPELFDDCKDDLNSFSQQHPDFFSGDEGSISTLDVFLQKIWQPIFQEYEQRAFIFRQRAPGGVNNGGIHHRALFQQQALGGQLPVLSIRRPIWYNGCQSSHPSICCRCLVKRET